MPLDQPSTAPGGDSHVHNLSNVYSELSQMQARDGGSGSAAFKRDLGQVNHQLQADGILPNLQITGIDNAGHILTQNTHTGDVASQNANAFYDGGQGQSAQVNSPLGVLAGASGIAMNADGGNVRSPADDAGSATGSVLNTIMSNLFGAGNDSVQSGASAVGMNSFAAKAWSGGWDETPDDPLPNPDLPT